MTAFRVDDYADRRYRITLTFTIPAESLAEAIGYASTLIGDPA